MPPNDTYLPGLITTDDRVANIHPDEWFRAIKTNGWMRTAPITAILNMTGSETTGSRKFHWWEQDELKTYGSITDVYSNAGLSSAYASGGVVGSTLYLKMAEEDANLMHDGTGLTIQDADGNVVAGEVTGVARAGASSYAVFKLTVADSGNMLAGATLYYTLQNDAQPEHSELPEGFSRDPEEKTNCTQISMEAIEISGTEMEELERISPTKWQRMLVDSQERMLRGQEETLLFGEYKFGTKDGKPYRRTRGMYAAIRDNVSANIVNYKTDASYSGQSWNKGGLNWLEELTVDFSLRGQGKGKNLYTSLAAISAIQKAVRHSSHYNMDVGTTSWGTRIFQLNGLAQTWTLIPHPAFTNHPARQTWGFLTEPGLINKVVFRNRGMKFIRPSTGDDNGYVFVDGKKAGWMEEWGLMYHNLDSQGFLKGIGVANTA